MVTLIPFCSPKRYGSQSGSRLLILRELWLTCSRVFVFTAMHTTHRNAFTIRYRHALYCYQSISLVQNMVIVDVMKQQNNYIMYLTDIIIIIVSLCVSNTTYITVNYITFWIIFINKLSSYIITKRNV